MYVKNLLWDALICKSRRRLKKCDEIVCKWYNVKFHCTCCSTKIEAFRRIIGWWAFRFSDMIVFSHCAVTKYSDNRKWMYLSVLFHIMSGMIYWYLFVYIITYVLILYKIMIFAKIWWLFMLGYNDWHCTMMFRIQCSIALLHNGHWYSCDMEHVLIL